MRAFLRSIVVALCGVTLVLPNVVFAGPASAEPDLKAVETGFAEGMAAYERGDYQAALKTWNTAVALLPETPEHRPNRIALYEMMVKAYHKELERVAADAAAYEAIARDAMSTLDGYAQKFAAAYPDEPLPPPVAGTRELARDIVAAAEKKKAEEAKPKPEVKPVVKPVPPPPPPAKPWKPFAIAGGVGLGVGVGMLAMFGAGYSRAKEAQSYVDDPANGCDLDNLTGDCADTDAQGRASNKMAITGIATAPLFIGAGAALMVVAFKRKAKNNNRLVAPVWSPSMAGVVFEQRF